MDREYVFTFDLDVIFLDELERLEPDFSSLEGKDFLCFEEEIALERELERVFLEGYDFMEELELLELAEKVRFEVCFLC